jgi:hypothetical protein
MLNNRSIFIILLKLHKFLQDRIQRRYFYLLYFTLHKLDNEHNL